MTLTSNNNNEKIDLILIKYMLQLLNYKRHHKKINNKMVIDNDNEIVNPGK